MTTSGIVALHAAPSVPLVTLSLAAGILIANTVFDLTAKLAVLQGRARWGRLAGGSAALGFALWSMQYIAAPAAAGVAVRYDLLSMLLSLAAAVFAAGTLFLLAVRRSLKGTSLLGGGLFAGGLLLAMQAIGSNALRLPGAVSYALAPLSLAILLTPAVVLGLIRLASIMKDHTIGWSWQKLGYAVGIGASLLGMHLAWCAALRFMPSPRTIVNTGSTVEFSRFGQDALAMLTIAILLLVLVSLVVDQRTSRHALELQLNEERHRMAIALTAQRVSRLENEALVKEIQERKKVEAALNHAAFHDGLTGLHNRVYFMGQLSRALKNVQGQNRSRNRFAVLYIDLDNFKSVNDVLGHRAGDSVLQEVARRLNQCTREEDTLARMGGDEFTLLFFHFQHTGQALRTAQRLLNVIEEPLILSGMRIPLSASIGLCEVDANYTEAEDILRDADTAMYNAKRQGGARVVVYDESMYQQALSALQEKQQLKAAVDNNEFVLHYQPLVNLRDNSIYGVEALVRWNHPTRGLLGPNAFISLAEESGHIVSLGAWVLRQACIEFQRLQGFSSRDLVLSVNVSNLQLEEDNFYQELTRVLHDSSMNPRLLQLEMTESIFLKDATRIGALLREVRSLGVRIALDDFGTGYSSLSYLEKYPIDSLKIDQTFVQRMRRGSVNADIVQLTIKLAQAIGISVTAEGVEEPKQAFDLMEYGCEVAQGYLYSRPIPLDAMTTLLLQGVPSRPDGDNRPFYSAIN